MFTNRTAFPWVTLIGVIFLGLMVVALWGQVFPASGTTVLPEGEIPTSAGAIEYQGGSINIIIGAAMLVLIVLGAWLSFRRQSDAEHLT